MASLAACSTGGGGLRWSAQSCGPRRQSWRRMALEAPVWLGIVLLCRRDRRHGKPGGMLHWGSGLRWSAQSCGPRRQSWRRMAFGAPAQLGIVRLCRRDRRHGKPGGLLHWGQRLEVERAVLRATPPVLAADGVGTPAPLGIVSLCRRRQYGVCLYGLSYFSLRLVHPALDHRYSSGDLAKPACTGFSSMYFAIRAHSCSFLTQWS